MSSAPGLDDPGGDTSWDGCFGGEDGRTGDPGEAVVAGGTSGAEDDLDPAPKTWDVGGVDGPAASPFSCFSISDFSSSDIIVVAAVVISFMMEISPIWNTSTGMDEIKEE